MDSIKLMVLEHENILRMNKVIRKACEQILEGADVCTEDFRLMINFIRNYADKHHHGKEEQILFQQMQSHLGNIGTNLVKHGMLVEHDFGRMFVADLEAALNEYDGQKETSAKLNILANATSYTTLLQKHIDKENEIVYTFAEKNLSDNILEDIEVRTAEFEKIAKNNNVVEHYTGLLLSLEKKYL